MRKLKLLGALLAVMAVMASSLVSPAMAWHWGSSHRDDCEWRLVWDPWWHDWYWAWVCDEPSRFTSWAPWGPVSYWDDDDDHWKDDDDHWKDDDHWGGHRW